MQGATTERIIDQVRKCPSGALSYFINADTAETKSPGAVIGESAPVMKIEVTPNGPYIINTNCLIVHRDGKEEMRTGRITLCRCGQSQNKPYCDGSHNKIGFKG